MLRRRKIGIPRCLHDGSTSDRARPLRQTNRHAPHTTRCNSALSAATNCSVSPPLPDPVGHPNSTPRPLWRRRRVVIVGLEVTGHERRRSCRRPSAHGSRKPDTRWPSRSVPSAMLPSRDLVHLLEPARASEEGLRLNPYPRAGRRRTGPAKDQLSPSVGHARDRVQVDSTM